MSSPRKNDNFSPRSYKSRGSTTNKSNKSTGRRDPKLLANNIRRPTKLDYNVDLKNLKPIAIKEKKVDLSRETKNLIRKNKLGSSRKVSQIEKPLETQLAVELEDPANEFLRLDIQRIMQMISEVNSLSNDYEQINEVKTELKEAIKEVMNKNADMSLSKSHKRCKIN